MYEKKKELDITREAARGRMEEVKEGVKKSLSREEMIKEKKEQFMKGRRGSRFDILKPESGAEDAVLYRQELITYDKAEDKNKKMWDLMATYLGSDERSIQRQLVNHVEYTLGKTRFSFDKQACYKAAAYAIRDRLTEGFNDTNVHYHSGLDPKRVYYLSMEYLLGRLMQNSLVNIDLERQFSDALLDLGYSMEEIYTEETDPGLGNGGLGRLAACFLDSMATLNLPAWGYGIRYNYGIFKQKIEEGSQVEIPDYWLANGNPWEIERNDVTYDIPMYGETEKYWEGGVERVRWNPGEVVVAMAYDTPIPGYNTFNTNCLRLWKSCPTNEFDFKLFNTGDYEGAIKARQRAEYISSVLYPNDNAPSGKELRLKQEYFFSAASVKDIIRRFLKVKRDWDDFPKKVAMQLNDTHPAIAIVELLRILIDDHKLTWEQAWRITTKTYSYTNHTILPEALEKWSVDLLGRLLPRHLQIIYLVNHLFLQKVRAKFPNEEERIMRMSFVQEGMPKMVRMANMCVTCCHTVNGVAALHTELIKDVLFKDFYEYTPHKFQNKTNGVTPRRWLYSCNKSLSDIITDRLGHDGWIKDLELLEELQPHADNVDLHNEWAECKHDNKKKLVEWVKKECQIEIKSKFLFDVHVKRIHEYKRQLMNILYVIYRYISLKKLSPSQRKNTVPRVVFFGGKAAPGYINAKLTIKLINYVGKVINSDPDMNDYLKVVYLPNYCVSNAQIIIPAADLSQHISTAGTEASGTSNMKFAMNGSLIIGTMDGANVEIAEEIGKENMFIFGADVAKISEFRKQMNSGNRSYVGSRLREVFNEIFKGRFGDLGDCYPMLGGLIEGRDFYCICWDFYDYIRAQEEVDNTYKDSKKWWKMSIMSVAMSGKFSSDRTIHEYAEEIWHVDPIIVPPPSTTAIQHVRSFPNMQ